MRVPRSLFVICATMVCGSGAILFACSDTAGDKPPPLEDLTDASGSPDRSVVVTTDPCNPPQENCPCADAGAGAQLYCGTVYRTTGNHVDCAKGYRTCIDPGDGGTMQWGACEGPRIFNLE